MNGLIETIPNVSEGRDRAAIDAIAMRAAAADGVELLDLSSDPDHHRTVLTLAGRAAGIRAAVLALCGAAIEAIDLRRHRGVHPRVGAIDVVPLVPLGDVPMERCVALARELGRAIADRFSLPVYLYEEAARRPERAALETIRRGGFERFADKIDRDGWEPDFGPRRVHPTAGVVVVGARHPLVAFNVDLSTADIAVARDIAGALRSRDGGLPFVKAIGLYLESRHRAQVSMNLVDYRRTPIHRAYERVRAEAERRGVQIAGTEVIGLVPRAAVLHPGGHTLGWKGIAAEQILENRLGVGPAWPDG